MNSLPAPTPDRPKRPGAWRKPFLRTMRRTGNVTYSCRVAGVSIRRAYQARKQSERFRKAWKIAKAEAHQAMCDAMEAELYRRAMGWKEAIYNRRGEVIGYREQHSVRCMIFWLEHNHPRYMKAARNAVEVRVGSPDDERIAAHRRMLEADPRYAEISRKMQELMDEHRATGSQKAIGSSSQVFEV